MVAHKKPPPFVSIRVDTLRTYLPICGPSAWAVYCAIVARWSADTKATWPSQTTIASDTGLAAPTVIRALSRLAGSDGVFAQHNLEPLLIITELPKEQDSRIPARSRRGGKPNKLYRLPMHERDLKMITSGKNSSRSPPSRANQPKESLG